MRTYVSAHTKAIVVGRQIDRKIVARTCRFPFNKKVGQQTIDRAWCTMRVRTFTDYPVESTHIMRAVALYSAKILIFNL
jgi:hypothetical protein